MADDDDNFPALREKTLARVHNLVSHPERNGTCVKLGKRQHPESENERWEATDEFTGAEAQYRPTNLAPLPSLSPLATSLYRLLTTPFLISGGSSNDLIYHIVSHGDGIPLMHLSQFVDKSVARQLPLAPQARLEVMRAAAHELLAVHVDFALLREDTCLRRPPLPQSAHEQVSAPMVDTEVELTALLIGAAADALPSTITLPPRVDYLHALADSLDAPSVAPYPLLGKAKGGQRIEQPVLYAAVGGAADAMQLRPLNALATALAGVEVRGDALLTALEYRDSEGVHGRLSTREPCELPAVLTALHKRSGDVVEFVHTKLGRPLLGSGTIPRVEAWPVGLTVSGAPCPSPKNLLLEYGQAFPNRASVRAPLRAWAVGPDGVSPPAKTVPTRGFRAGFALDWPIDAPPPPGGTRTEGGEDGSPPCVVEMCTDVYSRKAASKQKDKVQSAEPQATVMLLRALHQRNRWLIAAAAADGLSPANAAIAAHTPTLRSIEVTTTTDAGGEGDDESGDESPSHAPGSMLSVSYTLKLLPAGMEVLPTDDETDQNHEHEHEDGRAEAAEAGGGAGGTRTLLTLEERDHDKVLLGGSVLTPVIEDVIAEMAVGAEQRLLLSASLLGHPVKCQLRIALHAVEPPEEETPQQLHFNAFHPAGNGLPHWRERLTFVADLVASWAANDLASSLLDVGCGEGKLLTELITRRVPFTNMLGVETVDRAIRCAQRKLTKAAVAAAADAAAAAAANDANAPPAAHAPPHVELLSVDLTELHASCDAMTLIEVVEHLDWWVLEQLGPALLGRCKPRLLLVTTPNKEYSLNWVQQPKDWVAGAMRVPDPAGYEVRNPDHRFEFTRAEFRAWAEKLASEYHYTVTFHGIGGGPMDEVVPYGVWRGGGPQTQAVVFQRMGDAVAEAAVAAPLAAEGGAPAAVPALHEHAAALKWSSQ